ncbi:hypothetical protein [Aquitalea denitrificans]|uniref:hypothetical protein n=1 Tax=Aquitalea denitrificans TaxID=519081 RepID=UPI00135A7ACC|nr:hypothetical protein [Aquitalea denitrificans]
MKFFEILPSGLQEKAIWGIYLFDHLVTAVPKVHANPATGRKYSAVAYDPFSGETTPQPDGNTLHWLIRPVARTRRRYTWMRRMSAALTITGNVIRRQACRRPDIERRRSGIAT